MVRVGSTTDLGAVPEVCLMDVALIVLAHIFINSVLPIAVCKLPPCWGWREYAAVSGLMWLWTGWIYLASAVG